MKNCNALFLSFLLVFLIGHVNIVNSQTDKELLAELVQEEQDAVNALVLYPADIRKVILESSLHVEALIKVESIQSNTSKSFMDLMNGYSQDVQAMLWDLTRYPNLINRIVASQRSDIENILIDYPEVIHERALRAYREYFEILSKIDELNSAAANALEKILADYTPEERDYLRQLIELPEVLSIMTDNIKMTILVADIYASDPEWILHKADSLNLEMVRSNAREIEEWEKSLESDPAAFEEFQEAAQTYTEAYEYDDVYYSGTADDLYYDESGDRYYNEDEEEVIIQHHYYYHYPYWFGYPYWYEYPYWRPRPYWFDWGFYYNPGRRIVFIGLPSYHFTYWYFNEAYHHQHWSHLSAHFVRHYHRYPQAHNSITTNVIVWRNQNAGVISNRWLKNDGELSKRFREFGQFESARKKYNARNLKSPVSQREYVMKKSTKYPNLSKSSQEIRKFETTKNIKAKNSNDRQKAEKLIRTREAKPLNKQKTIERKSSRVQPKNLPKVDKGKEIHRDTWEKNKRKSTVTPRKANTQKAQPRKANTSTKKVTKKKKSNPRKN